MEDKRLSLENGIRNRVQLVILTITMAIGIQFYFYVRQLLGDGPIRISRPPGVEGFLPIGSLLAWKNLFLTGSWDPIHPAGMVILGFAAILSIGLRKAFCGWFCPIGTISEWIQKLSKVLGIKNKTLPRWIDLPLQSIKYLLLGFFLWAIFFNMDQAATKIFLQSSYWKVADVKMLYFFIHMSVTTGAVLIILFILSLLIRNFWCRYLCPYGALMGLLSIFSPTFIVRDDKTCIQCKKCSQVCPSNIMIHAKSRIISAECNGCMECTLVCPAANTLHLQTIGIKNPLTPRHLTLLVVAGFFLIKFIAEISGHWKSQLNEYELKIRVHQMYQDPSLYKHPTIGENRS